MRVPNIGRLIKVRDTSRPNHIAIDLECRIRLLARIRRLDECVIATGLCITMAGRVRGALQLLLVLVAECQMQATVFAAHVVSWRSELETDRHSRGFHCQVAGPQHHMVNFTTLRWVNCFQCLTVEDSRGSCVSPSASHENYFKAFINIGCTPAFHCRFSYHLPPLLPLHHSRSGDGI